MAQAVCMWIWIDWLLGTYCIGYLRSREFGSELGGCIALARVKEGEISDALAMLQLFLSIASRINSWS